MSSAKNDWVGLVISNGRYRVGAKLGEGGMGFVYKVHDVNLDSNVVIKVPRRSMLDDPEFAPRFSLEIRSLVKLAHPNIVRVSDVGEHDGLPFAVMQYLSGGSLEDRRPLDAAGRAIPAPRRSVLGWVPAVAAALDFMHAQGFVHRDVKPGNILFDEHGHAFLSDFGVAKAVSAMTEGTSRKATVTGAGLVLGTPEYMAPELIMGLKFDGRIDQYALATTVYEMLCGRRPFEGATATAILVQQSNQEPPPLRELTWDGADAVSSVVRKALAKRPDERFKNCVEFVTELERAILAAAGAEAEPASREIVAGRIECPGCSKPLKLPTKVLADLTAYDGKTCACPSCGSVLKLAGGRFGVVAGAGAGDRAESDSHGTRLFSAASGASAEIRPVPRDQPPTPPPPPAQSRRTATVVERPSDGAPDLARPRRAETVVERTTDEVPASRRAQTVIERAADAVPVARRAQTVVERVEGMPRPAAARTVLEIRPDRDPDLMEIIDEPPAVERSRLPLYAGIGTVALLLVVGLAVALKFAVRGADAPKRIELALATPSNPTDPTPAVVPPPAVEKTPSVSRSTQADPGGRAPNEAPKTKSANVAEPPRPEKPVVVEPEPAQEKPAPDDAPEIPPPTTEEPAEQPEAADPEPTVATKVSKEKVSLETVLRACYEL